MTMQDDLQRMEYIPGNYYNFHPGSHVRQGTEVGIEMISRTLNDIITEEQTTVVLLETMAGKGARSEAVLKNSRRLSTRSLCKKK